MKNFIIFLFLCYQILLIHGRPREEFEHSTVGNFDAPGEISEGMLTTQENEELQHRCGYYPDSQKKSRGSEPAVRKQAPWVVGLAAWEKGDPHSTKSFCSGTLISNRHVLTAWHCLAFLKVVDIIRKEVQEDDQTTEKNFDQFQFVFDDDCGASSTSSGCSVNNATIRKAVKAISPKMYTKHFVPGHKDVAVFELDQSVEFELDLYPACLSETAPTGSEVLDLYSFGRDNRNDMNTLQGSLQHIKLETEECPSSEFIDSICIRETYQHTRRGDSGGGLIHKMHGKNYVTGVVSGSTDNGLRDVAVASHLRWICKHTGICVNEKKIEQVSTLIKTITLS